MSDPPTDDDEPAIELVGVSKTYRVYHGHGRGWLASKLVPFASADRFSVANHALKDVELTVARGTILGVLGNNGSGKSTLMKLIAGVSLPTQGTIVVNGRSRCLLATGIGFNPLFTGRENIVYGSMAIGIDHRRAAERMDWIIDFAELRQQIDQPTMYYSAGMRSRLAFAVAFQDAPDVLVLDEALAVGDAQFQEKCSARIAEVCASGNTVLFVSHALPMVARLCTRAILFDKGLVIADGAPRDVVAQARTVGTSAGEHHQVQTSA